jgi:hypothetical protein
MTTEALRLRQLREIATRERSGYFPFKLLETVPWLLLACAGRLLMNHPLVILFLLLIQCVLLVAFVLAAHRAIEYFGGTTALGRMSLLAQWRLAKGILRRLLGLFLAAVLISLLLGMDKNEAPFFWLGFDALIHGRPGLHMLAWSAVVAVITYLMVVEKGLGRKPTYFAVLRQFASHAGELVLAAFLIVFSRHDECVAALDCELHTTSL